MQTTIDPHILEFLHGIGRVLAQSGELKPSLDDITLLIRPILNIDFVLIHQANQNEQNQIIYAKSLHFNTSFEGQMEWEELLANLVYTNQKTILQQPDNEDDKLIGAPHFLGIPLNCDNDQIGSLVFIRTKPHAFSPQDVIIAEFIAQQIAILLQRISLQKELAHLENQHRQSVIQEDFISNITHELLNPLGCIKGYSTTLLRSDVSWDKSTQAQFLRIIDQETDRLSELIDNLLDSARLQSGQLDIQFQLLRLDALAKDVIRFARLQNDNINIHLEMKMHLRSIMGDSRRITQVLENLISNAIKHAPGSDINIRLDQNDLGIKISIKDNGPGIPEQYHEKIFDRFFRVPNQAPNIHGSGLGLYISKQIIHAHQGTIFVKSKVGHGAEFIIFFPFKKMNC